jgi:hypothetical protein
MLKVFKECCKNCLLSQDRIVSSKRAKEILQSCAKNQTHFICHKASMDGKDIMCKNFHDTLGHKSQMLRIAQRLNMVEFVDQTDSEKLPTHTEMSKKNKR